MKSSSLRTPDAALHLRELEHLRGWFLDALEIGAGMVDAGTALRAGSDSFAVLRELGPRLRSLFGYQRYVFLRIDEQDHDFKFYDHWPAADRDGLQQEIDHQIERGAFAWALTQTRPVIGRTRDDHHTLVMQVIATRSRIRGMFVGVLDQSAAGMRDSMQQVLAMILSNAANAIENHELYDYIREQNRGLERTVEERTAALEQARVEAEAANETKGRFLANMSHEIRTPLTAIIGFSEMLHDPSLPDDERRAAVTTILETGRHLLAILNDVLDLSRLEADRLALEITDTALFDIVRRVVAVIEPQAVGKGLAFRVDYRFPLPPVIRTDPTRLMQILFNLLSNAVKFTDQGSITLTVACDAPRQEISFEIADSGIGLTSEQQQRLFAAFSQADVSTTRRYGGTGLGLHISRLLAEQLGGGIALVSESGRGSRFTVSIAAGVDCDPAVLVSALPLPVAAGNGQVSGVDVPLPSSSLAESLAGRVLLAEDDPHIRRLIALYLRDSGIELVEVDNGRALVEQALAGDYDLVITDLQMPEMDGHEAVEWLRRAGFGRPVIALSAGTLSGERDRCLAAGCDAFLAKPMQRAELLALLAAHLGAAGDSAAARDALEQDADWQAARRGFIDSLDELRGEWAACADHGDLDGQRALAHRLRGCAGGFGFVTLGELAGGFEAAVIAGEIQVISELEQALIQEIGAIMTGESP